MMDNTNSQSGAGIQALIRPRAKVHAFYITKGLYSRIKGDLLPEERAAAERAIEHLSRGGPAELDTAARLLEQAGFDVMIVQ